MYKGFYNRYLIKAGLFGFIYLVGYIFFWKVIPMPSPWVWSLMVSMFIQKTLLRYVA